MPTKKLSRVLSPQQGHALSDYSGEIPSISISNYRIVSFNLDRSNCGVVVDTCTTGRMLGVFVDLSECDEVNDFDD
jgi:hypothetical protein